MYGYKVDGLYTRNQHDKDVGLLLWENISVYRIYLDEAWNRLSSAYTMEGKLFIVRFERCLVVLRRGWDEDERKNGCAL